MSCLNCFKVYDIGGKLGDEHNQEIACRIESAFSQHLNPKYVAKIKIIIEEGF